MRPAQRALSRERSELHFDAQPVRYDVIDDMLVRLVDEDGRREGAETTIEAGANHRAVAVALARKQWQAAHPNGDFLIRDLEYEDQYNAPV